jgi:hypothetical protein
VFSQPFINISGGYPDLSDYILSDLSKHAVNDGVFSVVDRAQLDAVRAELNFSWSGEVDDSSAQEIGKMLGAQTIVSGSVRKIGALYRLDIRAIAVQTAEVQGQWNKNIPNGATIAALAVTTSSGATAAGGQASGQTAAGTRTSGGSAASGSAAGSQPSSGGQAAAPARPAAPKNGTYNFYPRPRAMQNGVDVNTYLDRIVIRSGYFIVYLTSSPQGQEKGYGLVWQNLYWQVVLQDLDNPRLSWEGMRDTKEITFQNVTARRFSLTNTYTKGVFEEINLDNAEYEP